MSARPALEFQWLSPPGISVALFLGYGALNMLVSVVIPGLSRRVGTNELPQQRVDLLSMLWLAFGVFQMGIVWFGLRARQTWALWIVGAADLAQLVGWVFYGIQTRDWYAPLFLYAAIFVIPAILFGWIGLSYRRTSHAGRTEYHNKRPIGDVFAFITGPKAQA